MELRRAEQGHREPGGEQDLLGRELGAVVAVRDAVDADDGDVDQVPQPRPVDRLHEAPGAGDVDLPGVAAGIAGGMDDHLRPPHRRTEVAAGREIAADSPGAGPSARHPPDRVARRLERFCEALSEATGPTGDEYVHVPQSDAPSHARALRFHLT